MVRARVVSRREETRVALVVTTFAASVLLLVLLDDIVKLRFLPGPGGFVYAFVAAIIALAGIGPWLAWTSRGDLAKVSISPGRVVAGDVVFTTDDVKGVAVAQGARGRSVAITHGPRGRVTFLEVEHEEEVEEILRALGQERAPSATIPLQKQGRLLAIWQAMLTWACVVCAPLYWLSAVGEGFSSHGKATFGITGVCAAIASALFLALRQVLRGQAVAIRRGAYDAHVALHHDAPVPTAAEKARDAEKEGQPFAPKTTSALARGNEPVRAWLARLDALPNEGHAYRGDAMKKDMLWETLSDDGMPLETRMGAARLLARRHGEDQRSLVRVAEDPDVRVRIEAALEEEEEVAEERIERLGPLFRAR